MRGKFFLPMRVDFHLFDLINGLAGRAAWLDAAGRYVAVFGLLAVLLAALSLLWWPRLEASARRRCLLALLLAGAGCALCFGLAWLLAEHFHLQRARPANARWATLLITEQSAMAFPAWPAVLAAALAVPSMLLRRAPGLAMALLALLQGLALVFVGVNYPADILTGLLLGAAIGATAARVAGLSSPRPRRLAALWGALALWGVLLAVAMRPASTEGDLPLSAERPAAVRLTPPAALPPHLRALAAPARVEVEAATNGRLRVAWLRVIFSESPVPKPRAETMARDLVNAVFADWPALDLLTVKVAEATPHAHGAKVGTLYTVTVAREAWPAGGFPPGQALPGRKFFHPRYYR